MDPEQIQTGEQLAGQLRELFHLGGWRIHRLAERAGLSKATVQGILSGTTMIPQAGTLTEFVRACGQDPGPWVSAAGPCRASRQRRRRDADPCDECATDRARFRRPCRRA
jgi:transcriptional regulator with XRE-family HTH domain